MGEVEKSPTLYFLAALQQWVLIEEPSAMQSAFIVLDKKTHPDHICRVRIVDAQLASLGWAFSQFFS